MAEPTLRRRLCLGLAMAAAAPWAVAQPRQKRQVGVVCPGAGAFADEVAALQKQAIGKLRSPFELEFVMAYYDDDTQPPRAQANFVAKRGYHLAVAVSTSAMLALARIPQVTPVVFVGVDDPVGFGFVDSWARPGRNATGISNGDESLIAKRLEFVSEVMPSCTRLGLIHVGGHSATTPFTVSRWRLAAAGLNMQMIPLDIAGGLSGAIEEAVRRNVHAAVVVMDSRHQRTIDRLIQFQYDARIPLFFPARWHVARGGLGALGPSSVEQATRAGHLVARILDGEQPAQIPVELPRTLEPYLSTSAMAKLGIVPPSTARIRATEI